MTTGPSHWAETPPHHSGTETWDVAKNSSSGSAESGGTVTIFIPGEVLDDRFKILRFLGQGGMGQVFEAEDLELGARVALKVIRPDLSRQARAIERFKQEVHLARQVTHPNICRIFDLFQHRLVDDWGKEHPPIFFVTMELLDGNTLAQHVRQAGPLAPQEALGVIEDLARGLDAAHRAGVLHLDLKASNIVLLDGPYGRRAVITDFGLARHLGSFEGSVRAGTPAYLAPELLTGEPVTVATDIYSLGVVVFEILTGQLPFQGANARETARLRLREQAPTPRRHQPGLPRAWEQGILRCLRRAPEKRFASAGHFLSVLREGRQDDSRPRWVSASLAVAAALVLLGVLLLFWRAQHQIPVEMAPSAVSQPRETRSGITVLGIKDLAPKPETAWIPIALQEMLTTELALADSLRPISGESVHRMKRDLDLHEIHELGPDSLARIRRYLHTDFVASGSCVPSSDGRIRFDLHLQDAVTGETVLSLSEQGETEKLFELVANAGVTLRRHFDSTTPARSKQLASGLPTSGQGARLYAMGLRELRSFEFSSACRLLTRASEESPESAAVQGALAECWSAQGYASRAEEAASRAFQLATDLGDEQKRLFEARYAEAGNRWDRAQELYGALFTVFPDTVEYGLRLASVEAADGAPQQALETLDRIRAGLGEERVPPSVDLVEAQVASSRGDLERQRRAAVRAIEAGRSLNADLLVAQARLLEAKALDRLGRLDQAREALQEVRNIYERRGDRRSLAWALLSFQDDRFPRRETRFEFDFDQALEIFRSSQDSLGEALALGRQARLASLRRETDLPVADGLHRALQIARDLDNRMLEAEILNHQGVYLESIGDPRVLEVLAQAEEMARSSGNLVLEHRTIGNRAVALMNRHRFRESHPLLHRAVEISRQISSRSDQATLLVNLASSHLMRGEMAEGERALQEAHRIVQETSHPIAEAVVHRLKADIALCRGEGKKALQRLSRPEGDSLPSLLDDPFHRAFHLVWSSPAEAVDFLRRLPRAENFRNLPDRDARYSNLLAWALLEKGDFEAARELGAPIRETLSNDARSGPRYLSRTVLARVDAISGPLEPALEIVDSIRQETWEAEDRITYLYASYHRVRLLETAGASARARQALVELTAEADEFGCPNIAARAAIVGGSPKARARHETGSTRPTSIISEARF